MEPDDFLQLMKARRNTYDLLRCFFLQEPTEQFLTALKEDNILNILNGYDKELNEGVELISSTLASPDLPGRVPDLLSEFTRLFVGPLPIPLYESVYRAESGLLMQEETLAVRRKYGEAGLLVDPDRSFPEDHIGAELEFVYYLCEKASQLEDQPLRQTLVRIQKEFFRDHLTAWITPFCNRLYAASKYSYFKGIARMTQGFIHWDYREIVSQLP